MNAFLSLNVAKIFVQAGLRCSPLVAGRDDDTGAVPFPLRVKCADGGGWLRFRIAARKRTVAEHVANSHSRKMATPAE